MKNCAGVALFDAAAVQQTLVRRLDAVIADHFGVFVDGEHLWCDEFAFVDTARAHREVQRFALDDGAQVAAGAEQPAASVQAFGDGSEGRC